MWACVQVGTRVTRRLETTPEPRRIETSEYMRQVCLCFLLLLPRALHVAGAYLVFFTQVQCHLRVRAGQ